MILTTDTVRLPLLFTQSRLTSVGRLCASIGDTAVTEGWPTARTFATLLEHEVAEHATGARLVTVAAAARQFISRRPHQRSRPKIHRQRLAHPFRPPSSQHRQSDQRALMNPFPIQVGRKTQQ